MQGEGQEFESPRLHQPNPFAGRRKLKKPLHPRSRRPIIRPADPRPHRAPDPCPPPRRSPTSGTLGGGSAFGRDVVGPRLGGAWHLDNWIWFGRSSLRSCRVVKKHDPDRSRPRLTTWSEAGGGQATKGTGWMPWRQEPMKDVAGCVKLRGVASRQ